MTTALFSTSFPKRHYRDRFCLLKVQTSVSLFDDPVLWKDSQVLSKEWGTRSHSQLKLDAMENTLFDQTFRDSNGSIVIAQRPNLPLLIGLAATLLNLLPTEGNLHTGLEALAFGSFFTWAWMELFQGVNYFRRLLGFVVLLGLLASKLQWV